MLAHIGGQFLMTPSILWRAPVPPAAKHLHKMLLPPSWFTVGILFMGLQVSPCFLQTYRWSLSTCERANCCLAFLWRFWRRGLFLVFQVLLMQNLFYCGYRYLSGCFLQHLHMVNCCCSGIDLHFSHQTTFISRRQNASPS